MSGDKFGPQRNPVSAWQQEIDQLLSGFDTQTPPPKLEVPSTQANNGRVYRILAASLATLTLVGFALNTSEKEGSAVVQYASDDFDETDETTTPVSETIQTTTTIKQSTITSAPVESVVRSTSSDDAEIVIIGDEECEADTEAALDMLATEAPKYLELVEDNIAIIECAPDGSGMYAFEEKPRFVVGDATREAGVEWYLGSIVHDAVHAELYSQYEEDNPGLPVPDDVWTGSDAEQTCLIVQVDALEEIDAPIELIDHLKKVHDTKYWEIDVDDRDW